MKEKPRKFNNLTGRKAMPDSSFFSGGTPLRRIFIVMAGALIFLALTSFFLWQDFSRFLGTKPLPIPKVAQTDQILFQDNCRTLIAGFFGGSKTQMTLAELNGLLSTASARPFWTENNQSSNGRPVVPRQPPIFVADGKGKIVVLVSGPMGTDTHFNALLLYQPEAGAPPPANGLAGPLTLTKVMVNGKELEPGLKKRLSRLIRIMYSQTFDYLANDKSEGTRKLPAHLQLKTVPTEPVEVKYANQTMYFNGYVP